MTDGPDESRPGYIPYVAEPAVVLGPAMRRLPLSAGPCELACLPGRPGFAGRPLAQ